MPCRSDPEPLTNVVPNSASNPYTLDGQKGFRTYFNHVPLSRKPVDVERAVQQADALRKGGKAEDIQADPLSETDMREVIPTLGIKSYTDILDADTIDDVLRRQGSAACYST